jgi:hypothetical protein
VSLESRGADKMVARVDTFLCCTKTEVPGGKGSAMSYSDAIGAHSKGPSNLMLNGDGR